MPPYATPTLVVATMVPSELVVSTVLGIWKSVVEPMLLIENRVVKAPLFDVEPTAKSVARAVELAAWTENWAKGVEVPTPTCPAFVTMRLVPVEEPTTN